MRVATWNINGGYGLKSIHPPQYSQAENLPYFISQLQALHPDVMCLQEVRNNEPRSQAQEIAEDLGYECVFEEKASPSHIDEAYQLCDALLSRCPFTNPRAFKLPAPAFHLRLPLLPSGERAAMHDKYLQAVEFEGFLLANTHLLPLHFLGANYDSNEGRGFAQEIEELFLAQLGTPLVLCSDFNFARIRETYPRFFRDLALIDPLPNEASQPRGGKIISSVPKAASRSRGAASYVR